MTDLFATHAARALFLEQLREIRRHRDNDRRTNERLTLTDLDLRRKQICMIDELLDELDYEFAQRTATDMASPERSGIDELRESYRETHVVGPTGSAPGMQMLAERGRDMQRVFEAAIAVLGDAARAQVWLDVPLPEHHPHTPRELVEAGRADTVLDHVRGLGAGFSHLVESR